MVKTKSTKTKKISEKEEKPKKPARNPRVKKEKAEKKISKPKAKPEKYYEAVGKRKTAVARVRLSSKGKREFLVNEESLEKYFPDFELQQIAQASLETMKCLDKFKVSARVKGGGLHAQAEAVRHGTAKALIIFNPEFRKRLKKVGYLTRDPRMRERKKFGLKRARRAPQWSKR
jgi:small subunit ribosomal protein S9